MGSTPHYGFTLFDGTDRPTWLKDWNETITKIDTTIHRIATGGGDLPDLTEIVTRLQALEGRVDSDELRLNVVEGNIVDILSDLSTVSSDLSALATRVTTAESDIDTLETAVNTTIPAQIQSINDSITGILSSISSMTSDISGLSTRVTTAEDNISTNTSDISSLDTRVTTLETSGGSVPALEARVTTAEGKIATNTSDISALDTRLTTAEGNISTNATNISTNTSGITNLNSRMSTAEGNISTNASNISALDTRVTTAEGNISTNSANIATNSTNISGLDTRVTALENTPASSGYEEIDLTGWQTTSSDQTAYNIPVGVSGGTTEEPIGNYLIRNGYKGLKIILVGTEAGPINAFYYYWDAEALKKWSDSVALTAGFEVPATYNNVYVYFRPLLGGTAQAPTLLFRGQSSLSGRSVFKVKGIKF